jgi:sigma-54-interacting transcriptional regulator
VEPAVSYLMRHSTGLLRTCRLPGTLSVPANPIDTFVIHDVAAMSIAQQIELFDWMTGAGRGVQVISVTSRPLAQLVAEGRFFEGLFHLLKAVCLVTVPRTRVNRHASRPPTSCPAIWRSAVEAHP